MTTEALRRDIGKFLETHNTVSLATTRADRPWAASVFYASDGDLHLYFVTAPATRHGRDLAANARVAGTINADVDSWAAITGVQLTGQAGPVRAADRDRILRLYLDKFPEIAALLKAPRSDQDRLIAERLAATPFYGLRPGWIRLIDNRRGFGFKQELVLD